MENKNRTKTIICELCKENVISIDNHMKFKHKDTKVYCELCGKYYKDIIAHKQTMHKNKDILCIGCGKVFKKYYFKKHNCRNTLINLNNNELQDIKENQIKYINLVNDLMQNKNQGIDTIN